MPIVKYPEYSVEIIVKEGTGEISSATFSGTLDPMSTSNMVLLEKKNTNLKPFIFGVSKWGEDYHYLPNTYKGISTIGGGKNAIITLVFSQPVDHFTLYFDDNAQSMPLSLTVDSQTFSNDDYMFTYSQDTMQTTFTITINEINEVNGVEMPLMIVGIENRIALDITHRTGLRKLRTGHTYTKDKGKPAYGIISQEGALGIFDFYTEINDLIELGLLYSKMDITVKFQDNVVGKYTSDKWTENQTSLFNVSLNDKLIGWQNIYVAKNYEIGFSGSKIIPYSSESGLLTLSIGDLKLNDYIFKDSIKITDIENPSTNFIATLTDINAFKNGAIKYTDNIYGTYTIEHTSPYYWLVSFPNTDRQLLTYVDYEDDDLLFNALLSGFGISVSLTPTIGQKIMIVCDKRDFGEYEFIYNGTNWTLNEEIVDLKHYGINVDDGLTILENDKIVIRYFYNTAKDLLNYLMGLEEVNTFDEIDDETSTLLDNITITYYFWDKQTRWNLWVLLCETAQLYVFLNSKGKIKVISQKHINSLKSSYLEKPIIIPYTLIDGSPAIDRIDDTKISIVTGTNYSYNTEYESIFRNKFILSSQSDTYEDTYTQVSNAGYDESANSSAYNIVLPTNSIDLNGTIYNIKPIYTNPPGSFGELHWHLYIVDIKKDFNYPYAVKDLVISTDYEVIYLNDGLEQFEKYNRKLTINLGNKILTSSFLEFKSVEEFLNTYFDINGTDFVLRENPVFSINNAMFGFVDNEGSITIIMLLRHYSLDNILEIKNGHYLYWDLNIYLSQLKNTTSELSYGIEKNKTHQLASSNFYSDTTTISSQKLIEYNSNQILNNYTGKQTISFRMATDTLYDKTGSKVYDINLGQTLQELDLIQLRKTDGQYDSKIWQISKVEHEVGGSKWLNIEAVEI